MEKCNIPSFGSMDDIRPEEHRAAELESVIKRNRYQALEATTEVTTDSFRIHISIPTRDINLITSCSSNLNKGMLYM